MKTFKQKIAKATHAISNTISTIILTGILFTILVVAMFVATGILGGQLTSTEFNQAQSNMLLLDSTIQDTSLRPGAGGYVQFNEREGGIGITSTTDQLSITIQGDTKSYDLTELVYSGGTQASAAVDPAKGYTSLRGTDDIRVDLTGSIGFVRLEQDNGGKIKLDYDRVRITNAGQIDDDTDLIQVTFIQLNKGPITAGTGTVSVNVQNTGTETYTWTFEPQTEAQKIDITVNHAGEQRSTAYTLPEGKRVLVMLSVIQMEVSLR